MIKKRHYFLFVLLVPLLFSASCTDDTSENYILIYNGAVADQDGVASFAQQAEDQGYAVEYISTLTDLPDMLQGARAFVIGGTDGDTGDLLDALYDVQDDLKSYIENGGRYLGICGGAYVASKGSQWEDGYETGMGLVDVESFAFDSENADPQVITIIWRGTQRAVYYQYGPAFQEEDIPSGSEILAYYSDEARSVAAFVSTVGSGKVLLCGPHPEADASWLLDYPEPRNAENWTDTRDIFNALLENLLEE